MAEIRVKETGTIKLFESDNTSSVTIASPASLSANKTITLPDADVTLASGTMLATDGSGASLTALNASELGSGTVPTARLGTGTASSSTVLYGDQTYKAEPGGGKVLQVSHRVTNSTAAGTHTSLTATDVYAAITPSATSSKILVMMTFSFRLARGGASPNISGATGGYAVYRDIGGAGYNILLPGIDTISYNFWGYTRDYATLPTIYLMYTPSLIFVDSPSTTSACTYKLYYQAYGGSTAYYGKGNNVDHTTLLEMDGS